MRLFDNDRKPPIPVLRADIIQDERELLANIRTRSR
jgi:hypothetical protein